jgi:hypothetical protein
VLHDAPPGGHPGTPTSGRPTTKTRKSDTGGLPDSPARLPQDRDQVPHDMSTDDPGVLVVWALLVWRCARRTSISDVPHTQLATMVGVGRDTVGRWLHRAEALGWLTIRQGHHTCTYMPLRRPARGDGRRCVRLEPTVAAALATGRIRAADLRVLMCFLREINRERAGYAARPLWELASRWGITRDFAPRRVHGEWFDLGDEDPVAAVTAVAAAVVR